MFAPIIFVGIVITPYCVGLHWREPSERLGICRQGEGDMAFELDDTAVFEGWFITSTPVSNSHSLRTNSFYCQVAGKAIDMYTVASATTRLQER